VTATVRPPVVPRWLVGRCLADEAQEAIVGDLDERLQADVARGLSISHARRRYWAHALMSIVRARPATHDRRQSASASGAGRNSWFRGSWGDARYVVRGLARSPGYVAVAVLSLAIGIGANVATLAVMRAVVFQDLPVVRPAELQWVSWGHPKAVGRHVSNFNSSNGSNYSTPAFAALRQVAGARRIPLLGFTFTRRLTLAAGDQAPIDGNGMLVSPEFFSTLGLPVAFGRPLGPTDDAPGAAPVAVISYDLWQRLYGGESTVLGRPLTINGVSFDIIGVTGAAYHGMSIGGFFPPTDVTIPLSAQPIVAAAFSGDVALATDPTRMWIHVIVRLPESADAEGFVRDATAALSLQDSALGGADATGGQTAVVLSTARRGVDTVGRGAAQPLTILSVASALVLLIACANLPGIMLPRAIARQREIAVRRALGASRIVLIRQWLIESAILATAGGAAGVVAAIWSGPVLVRLLTTGLGPVAIRLGVDWNLVGIAIGMTTLTAVLCGAIPAIRLTGGGNVGGGLRTRVVGADSPKLTIGRVLIAIQVAISMPLLVGALLFLQTLHNLASVNLGFDSKGLVTFQINPPRPAFGTVAATQPPGPDALHLTRELLQAIEAVPGVTSATMVENPLVSGISSNTQATINGQSVDVAMEAIGPRFFETMRIPLVAGRTITIRDDGLAPPVAVVNQVVVRRYFGGASPIGQTITIGKRSLQIVGVVADSLYDSLKRDPRPTFYDSYLQRPGGTYATYVTVRTAVAPRSLAAPLAAAVAGVDRSVPITNLKTQDDQIEQTTGRERVFTRLLTLFGAFALALACIGLHGLTSYAVSRRTNEIGIRLALGAQRAEVLLMMLRQVVVLALIGLFAGIPLALVSSKFVSAFIFGVTPRDPLTLGGVAVVLLVAATAAGWIPARRAARMEALTALRCE
jgi:predicted permease